MTVWTHDPARAASEPRPMPRPQYTAPHWMRCEWYRVMPDAEPVRCRLAAGHIGEHKGAPPGPCSEESGRWVVPPECPHGHDPRVCQDCAPAQMSPVNGLANGDV